MNNENPPNASDYFEFKIQESGQILQTGPALQANGQSLLGPQVPTYPGYDVLRFPLIDPPSDGSIIEARPVYYSFNDNSFAPHPVNLSGIPFEQTMMEIELNALSAPEIDSIYNLSEDNNSLIVKFSEGIYSSNNQQGVSLAQFTIETNPTSLSPSISYITNGTTAPLPGDSILIFNLSMLPSSGSESIRIRANENSVFSSSGIAMGPQWSNSILLNDKLPPEIISYEFDPDSTTVGVIPETNIKIVFDNPVDLEGEANISSITFDNIIFLKYENDGVLGDAIGFNAAINSFRDTITVDPDTALIQLSRVLLKVAGDTIVDANNNIMNEKQSRFNVADIVIPEIQSSSIAENNEYVLINFSEALWSEIDQSGNIVPSDFIIEASTPSPDVPLIKPKDVYSLFIFIFIYSYFCIIVDSKHKVV